MSQFTNIVVGRNDIKKIADILKDFYDGKAAQFAKTEADVAAEKREKDAWEDYRNANRIYDEQKFPYKLHKDADGEAKLDFDITYKDQNTIRSKDYNYAMSELENNPQLIAEIRMELSIWYSKEYKSDVFWISDRGNLVRQNINIRFTEKRVWYDSTQENDDEGGVDRLKNRIYGILNELPPRYDKTIRNRFSIKMMRQLAVGSLLVGAAMVGVLVVNYFQNFFSIDAVSIPYWPLILYAALAFIFSLILPSPKLNGLYRGLIPDQRYYYNDKTREGGKSDDVQGFKSDCEVMIGQFAGNTGKREKINAVYKKSLIFAPVMFLVGLAAMFAIIYFLY
ncbi:MAG: hypothetical protein FWE53_05090 [Firmicutes bacterium]|nr:hypothetical protein [Bacillota bacterium]